MSGPLPAPGASRAGTSEAVRDALWRVGLVSRLTSRRPSVLRAVVVGVNTSPNFVAPSGHLAVVDPVARAIVREIDLGSQPDAGDVTSPGGAFPWYIAVAIENERDEDLGDGAPPQLPPGKVSIVTIDGPGALADPSAWTVRDVTMTGLDGCAFPDDPEPEYVVIDPENERALVTLQENNCHAVIDLAGASVLHSFDAGAVALTDIDMSMDGVISQTQATNGDGLKREPDGAAWIGGTGLFATANEGDLAGGSRGWTVFNATGGVVFDSGNALELEAVRIGHLPEARSGKKGNEPENIGRV